MILNLSLNADGRLIGTYVQSFEGSVPRDVVPMFPLDVIVLVDGKPPSASVCQRFILQNRSSVPTQEADGNCHLRTIVAFGGAETSFHAVVMDTLTGATFSAGSAFQNATLYANLPPPPLMKRYRIRTMMLGLPWEGPFSLVLRPKPGPVGSITTSYSQRTSLVLQSDGGGFVDADLPAWTYDVGLFSGPVGARAFPATMDLQNL